MSPLWNVALSDVSSWNPLQHRNLILIYVAYHDLNLTLEFYPNCQGCVKNEEGSEYWFDAKEDLSVADISVMCKEMKKQQGKQDSIDSRGKVVCFKLINQIMVFIIEVLCSLTRHKYTGNKCQLGFQIFSFSSSESLYSAVFIHPCFSLKTSPAVLELKLVNAQPITWMEIFHFLSFSFFLCFFPMLDFSDTNGLCLEIWVTVMGVVRSARVLQAESLGVPCTSLQHWCS